jgi:hypothetical protein
MNKLGRIVVAVTFLLGLSVAANAELRNEVVVTLPFEFVISGARLPAGTYAVKRFSQQPFDVLMLTNNDTRRSIFVRPVDMEDASNNNTRVSFHKVGEQHVLSGIQTADYLYKFSVSRSVILEAAAKQRDTLSAPTTGGSK